MQIQNKLFQNLTKPLQCYANWYARYIRQISKQIFRISFVIEKMKKMDFKYFSYNYNMYIYICIQHRSIETLSAGYFYQQSFINIVAELNMSRI